MDRSWINASRISDVYEKGVEEFLQFAKRNVAGVNNKYYCLCVNCLNGRRQDIGLIREHVLCDGFLKSYTIWTWHGEVLEQYSSVSATECQYFNLYSEDCMEDMIRDIGEDSFHQAHVYGSLKDDPETKLYPSCSSFTRLSTVLDYLISRQEMSGLIKVSPNCSNCFIKFFQKVIHCQPVTMRQLMYVVYVAEDLYPHLIAYIGYFLRYSILN